jgi:hypothetical protein
MLKNNYSGRRNTFVSKKTGKTFKLRSLLERKFINLIEHDNRVLTYDYESLRIRYFTKNLEPKIYIPDFVVVYSDRTVKIVEVKPEVFVGTEEVQLKRIGVEEFLSVNYKNFKIKFEIITEIDLKGDRKKSINELVVKSVKKRKPKKRSSVSRHRNNGTK